MKLILLLIVFWASIFFMCQVKASVWWGMGKQLIIDPNRVCKKTRRLRGKQISICKNKPDIVNEVIKGAKLGINECQFQFKNRNWNCSNVRKSVRKLLNKDSRETSFLYSITSAGVAYSISQACSKGLLLDCSCDRRNYKHKVKGNFDWRGCSDNINFGYRKSKEFIEDGFSKRSDIKKMVLAHNFETGRLAVKNYMTTVCKCHGMSGSCSFKTCWKKLPLFREVGNRLKEKFDGAIKVTTGNDGKGFMPEEKGTKSPMNEDLVYSEDSPDFCQANSITGSLGTKGRICNQTSETDGCDLLCCGRGYSTHIKTEYVNCNCQFQWCCNVTCNICKVKKKVHVCL